MILWSLNSPFGELSSCTGQIAYVLRTLTTLSYRIATTFTARLACIRPAASVHPEPGSNSPLYKSLVRYFYLTVLLLTTQLIVGSVRQTQ